MVSWSSTKCILHLFNITVCAATLFSSNAQGSSVVHAVGGHLGWTVLAGRGFYQDWVDRSSIFVGDILHFEYDSTRHSVLQVEEKDYNSCTISEPLLFMWSGHDRVHLWDSAYFFVSGTPGDCEAGLKFFIRPLSRRGQQGRVRSSSRASLGIEGSRISMKAQPASPPSRSRNASMIPRPPSYVDPPPAPPTPSTASLVIILIVAGFVMAVVVLGVAVAALILNAQTHKIVKELKASNAETSRTSGPTDGRRLELRHYKLTSCRMYTLKELEAATGNFCKTLLLGQGGHGTVYKGKLEGQDVAVKKSICPVVHADTTKPAGVDHAHPSPDTLNDLGHAQCLNEITLLSKVHHRHLVRLLGYCLAGPDSLLVYEYVPNGTLKDHLHGSRRKPDIPTVKRIWLDWEKRLQIATETAEALHYLHFSVAPPVYHRDVKSSNILLDADMKVKLSDFGLSKLGKLEAGEGRVSPFGAKGTPGYIDPEYCSGRKEATDKSDVYSFGVVLLELITGKKPVDSAHAPDFYDPNLATRSIPFIENGHTNKIIDPDLGAVNDVQMMASIKRTARVALACLAARGVHRPSMDEVLEELRGIKSSNRSPLKRFQTSPKVLRSQVQDADHQPSPLSNMSNA